MPKIHTTATHARHTATVAVILLIRAEKINRCAAVTHYQLVVQRSVAVLSTDKQAAKYRAHKTYGKRKAK